MQFDLGLMCEDPINILRGIAGASGKGDFTAPSPFAVNIESEGALNRATSRVIDIQGLCS